jgi:hypothetical protein
MSMVTSRDLFSPRAITPFAALFPALALSSAALAQPCSLSANYRLVNTVVNGPAELAYNSGTYTGPAPLVAQRNNRGQNGQGCFSETTATSVADYGSLSFSATGSAAACSSGGVFLWIDSSGPSQRAGFRERITARSSTLPNLTPVTVRVAFSFTGSFSSTDTNPSVSLSAEAILNSTALRLNDVGTAFRDYTIIIGQPVELEGNLYVTIRNSGVLQGPPRTATFSADYDVTYTVTPITPGVTIETCSGATYAPPNPCDYDFNQDENIDLLDAQQMAQVFVGLITPEATWLDGDLNGDENADLTDAQILAAYVVTGVCGV